MKAWAVSRGGTHWTHWFQPMTVGGMSQRVRKALTVTFSARRYRNKANFGLAVEVWLLTSVLLTLNDV